MNSPFSLILHVTQPMHAFPAPWFVSGGWAIDLFLGQVTRPHADIEIGIYRNDQHALHQHFPNASFEKNLASLPPVPGSHGPQAKNFDSPFTK